MRNRSKEREYYERRLIILFMNERPEQIVEDFANINLSLTIPRKWRSFTLCEKDYGDGWVGTRELYRNKVFDYRKAYIGIKEHGFREYMRKSILEAIEARNKKQLIYDQKILESLELDKKVQ